MVRAKTMDMQGNSGPTGDVGGMYLEITGLGVAVRRLGVPVILIDLLCCSRYWRMEIKVSIWK
jgi:hypothetical protein